MVKYTSKQNIKDILEKLYSSINNASNNISLFSEFQKQLMTLYEAVFLNYIFNTTEFTLEIIEFLLGKLAIIMNSNDYLFMINNKSITEFLLICYAKMIKRPKDSKTSQDVLDFLFQMIGQIYIKVKDHIYINSDYKECIEIGIYNIFMKLPNDNITLKYLIRKTGENQYNELMLNLINKLIKAKFQSPKDNPPPARPPSGRKD